MNQTDFMWFSRGGGTPCSPGARRRKLSVHSQPLPLSQSEEPFNEGHALPCLPGGTCSIPAGRREVRDPPSLPHPHRPALICSRQTCLCELRGAGPLRHPREVGEGPEGKAGTGGLARGKGWLPRGCTQAATTGQPGCFLHSFLGRTRQELCPESLQEWHPTFQSLTAS